MAKDALMAKRRRRWLLLAFICRRRSQIEHRCIEIRIDLEIGHDRFVPRTFMIC
jgi:hypothetical protein